MGDERDGSDDSTRFTARRGTDDETRFTGVGPPPATGGKPEATFPPGSLLGHTYRIEAFLARGGMGEVYRARHAELNTEHAIKIILPELANNQRIVDLFRREASVLRNVRHDAVVAYDGVFRDENGRLYLVMEFADGPSLSKLMRERSLDADEVRQLRDRLADGLAVAHDKGVVHRDISPDNVILPGGDLGKAKIIDFGISKAVDPEVKTIIGDDFAGKFSYVSPEQLGMFGGQIDGRSDIYSLGLVLAAAAQGEPLDMGLSPISVIEARRAVPDLSRVPAAVRADLAAMLQPDPAKRPQSMREMIRPQDQRGGRRSAPSETSGRSSATTKRSGRIGAIVGALAVLVVAGGGFGYWYWQGRAGRDHASGTAQQADNGVPQNGTNSALNTGGADASSTTTQGAQESTASTPANQTQSSIPATSVENTGAGATGTQQQDAAFGTTVSAGTAEGGQANASNTAAPISGDASTAVVPTVTTNQTAAGTASGQQQVSNGSGSIAAPASSTQAAGVALSNDTPSPANTATASSGTSAGAAGTSVTDTQTALLPQVPDVEKLRSRAQEAVGGLQCADVLVDVSARGDIAASGYVASEADRAKVSGDLRALPQVGQVDNAVKVMTPPLCEALAVLHEETAYNAAAAPRIDPGGAGGIYYEKENLKVTVTAMSDGYLYVDYVDAKNEPSYVPTDPQEMDQYIIHLLPNDRWRKEERRVKAGERVVIGTLPDEMKNYVIEPPFGTYLIIAISSPERLFEPRPIQEPAADYLPALKDRLSRVAQSVGRGSLTASSTTIVFQPRQQ